MSAVDLGDVQLHVEDRGSGEPALVLVHGYTGSSLDWADSHDVLAADRRVVAHDNRGHGQSSHTTEYSIDLLAADLLGVLDGLGLEQVDLLGHSLGGIVAQKVVLAHPERLRSLILMDTGAEPVGDLASMLGPLVELGREQGMRAVFEMSRPFFVGVLSGDEDRIAVLTARIEEKYDQLDVEAFDRLGRELSTYPSMVDRLGEIAVPTTVLVGEGDTGLRASADQLAAGIPGAELVVLPGGHSPQEDDPAAWQAAVLAHLNRVG